MAGLSINVQLLEVVDSIVVTSGDAITISVCDAVLQDSVVQKDSILLFPTVGRGNVLYIDKSTNRSYRFDETQLHYKCVGSDYSEIGIVDGGMHLD